MAQRDSPTRADRQGRGRPGATDPRWPWVRDLVFTLVALLATALDVYLTVPPASMRDGHHYLLWDRLDVAVPTLVLTMGGLWMAALLVGRRYPVVGLILLAHASLALTTSHPWSQPMTGVLLMLFLSARRLPRRPAVIALVVGSMPLWAAPSLRGDDPARVDLVLSTAVFALLGVGVWLFGRREHAADRTASDLREELEAVGHEVAAEERQRIARELHDILAHSVSAMMMQAAGAGALTRTIAQGQPHEPRLDMVERALTSIERTGAQSMRELHRLLGALREDDADVAQVLAGADESRTRPGIGDIDALAELTRESGLSVQIHRSGQAVELDPSVRLAGYRVAQESLANAMKHAGRGAVVDIYKTWQPDRLQLQVRSRGGHDGVRPGAPGSGSGLVGLRERVELVGGTFESSWVGEEFVTTAVLPLTAPGVAGVAGAAGGRSDADAGGRDDALRGTTGRPSHIRPVDDPADGAA